MKIFKTKRILTVLMAVLMLEGLSGSAQIVKDNIYSDFINPPNSSRPRVWWHWLNGNITKEGISKDLEWMSRVGVGGFTTFDANLNTPQVVQKRLDFMRPEWKDAFSLAAKLADSLGLEMGIAGSPGWSESGGPWVSPKDGMKKFVWSELRVKEGQSNIRLPRPPDVTGPFQNIPKQPGMGGFVDTSKLPRFYRDVAVIAVRISDRNKTLEELGARVTSSGGKFTLQQLTDGDLQTSSLLPTDSAGEFSWIQFTFPHPQTIKAITMVGGSNPGAFGRGRTRDDFRQLEASNDGLNFYFICNISPGGILQQTISIPVTKATYFRIKIKNPTPADGGFGQLIGLNIKPNIPKGTPIAEIVLHPVDVVNHFEEKSGFAAVGALANDVTRITNDAISLDDVIDLTNKMKADGSLQWTVPAGRWKIIRFGYSLLGVTNHPASPEATGLEVDKLDSNAVRNYFETYLNMYKDATNGLMGDKGGLRFLTTDSWEAGSLNWTEDLPKEFLRRRGYSILPWLPVLTGAIVEDSKSSERFLNDFRKTLGEMVVKNHYDLLTEILNKYGMKRYSESHESGRALIADGMEIKRNAAIPMSAMWTKNPFINQGNQTGYEADIRESASVSHIYGQNLVAAESLTALGFPDKAWAYSPEDLKPTADLELASGLNRFVIHTSVHQPVDNKIPGLGLGPFGQWFNRLDTWAEFARPWTDYLSRSSYLLQQGKFVADILYYYGEGDNITSLFGKKLPDIPEGYNYDFINADALLNKLSFESGALTTPSGMKYKLLVLDSSSVHMSLNVLKKIETLVKDGAIIYGPKPVSPLGLKEDESIFNKIVNELWGGDSFSKKLGKGEIFSFGTVNEVLSALQITPDFDYSRLNDDVRILFVHRTLGDREIYWVNNRSDRNIKKDLSFRVPGEKVEIWRPESGLKEAASYKIKNGRTIVTVEFSPNDALFVVFERNSSPKPAKMEVATKKEAVLTSLDAPWTITFQEGRGAPDAITMDRLYSWTDSPIDGVKFFSGTAIYNQKVDVSLDLARPDSKLWLDLGDVKNIAEVIINGKSAGIVWKKPFRVEISNFLKNGDNQFEIKVTNLWVNRLIGDQQPGIQEKITYTTLPFYKADSPLLKSGLLGPVRVISEER